MRFKIIHRYIGLSMLMVAALMAVSGIVSLTMDNEGSSVPLFFSAFVTALFGSFPLIFVKGEPRISQKEGYWIVVGSWVLGCLFGMLPYIMYGGQFTPVNAFFESVSGFTTTGASILSDIECLPKGILFWRVSTAWVGGVGIITVFSLLVPNADGSRSMLSNTEISGIARENVHWKSGLFAYRIIIVYAGLTVLSSIALRICGLNWFDAISHAMSACSTCGFGNRNASIASFQNPAAEVVLTVTMLLAGMNLSLIFLSFTKGNHSRLLRDEIPRAYLAFFVLASLLICISLCFDGHRFPEALRLACFQAISISTTTGFATADTTLWPPLCIVVLLCCSFFCGCSGSTSGGMKIDRGILAFKGLQYKIRSLYNPRSVNSIRIDGMLKSADQVNYALIFIVCYLFIIVVGAILNAAFGLDPTTAITASISCMGNVGPGFGEVGSMGNYAHLPSILKISLSLEMLLGRLEIFPILYVLFGLKAK